MKCVPIVLACLAVSFAEAENIDSRILEAKSVTASAVGQSYDALMWPSIGEAMQMCIPPGSASPANLGNFTLVANVMADGSTKQIEVRPITSVSKCFAEKFSALQLPSPPKVLVSKKGVPIVVEMSVTE